MNSLWLHFSFVRGVTNGHPCLQWYTRKFPFENHLTWLSMCKQQIVIINSEPTRIHMQSIRSDKHIAILTVEKWNQPRSEQCCRHPKIARIRFAIKYDNNNKVEETLQPFVCKRDILVYGDVLHVWLAFTHTHTHIHIMVTDSTHPQCQNHFHFYLTILKWFIHISVSSHEFV